jgi:anti-sigma regulatory factor (Ser/Thr protein kinase)
MRDGLTNLLLNAVDAMPEGGTITLRTRQVIRDHQVIVEVQDTGIGMSETTRSRCLEPFFTTKGERGTGLGLPSVFSMVQRHGGDFEIDSVLGRGTTLRMIFPRPEGLMGDLPGGEPFIVPMAIPLVAGPSGMAAVMLMGSNEPDRLAEWSVALLIAWVATAVILFSATYLYRWLGTRVLIAVERLMGMLLVAISVQMFLDGLGTYLNGRV